MIAEPPHLAGRGIGLDEEQERRGHEHRRHRHLHRAFDRLTRTSRRGVDPGEPVDLGSGSGATEGPRHQRLEVGHHGAALGGRVEPRGNRNGEDPPVRRR